MRTFVMGDIHGAYKAMLQCFERSGFDKDKDRLIALGDVCDGWSQTKKCIEELLTVKNLIYILGNHDSWLLDWMLHGNTPSIWTDQGGMATLDSYGYWHNIPQSHKDFLKNTHLWFEEDNVLFVHGGLSGKTMDGENFSYKGRTVKNSGKFDILWDRDLITTAVVTEFNFYQSKPGAGTFEIPENLTKYKEIFLGHTTTENFKEYYGKKCFEPIHACEVWNLDTGAGWSGKLTIMDVKTKKYWQSDFISELYPKEKGRR